MRKTTTLFVSGAALIAVSVALVLGRHQDPTGPPDSDSAFSWDAAVDAIADSETYGGLRISPQRDLEPLGPDPHSGLWEFWLTSSGSRPNRSRTTGSIVTTAETGLALVLLPGGTFTMGAQRGDVAGANYDPQATPDEAPHRVTLAPFFIAKTEMTQGQWSRLAGSRPSRYDAHNRGGDDHPVEGVTWKDCAGALRDAGLEFPTEAQWEYAARAGTATPWWCGADAESIGRGGANLLDASAREISPMTDWDTHVNWDDGYIVHSPVGTFAPNPFGLHDVLGNVREWCRDRYASYDLPVRPGDGYRMAVEGEDRVIRGGCFRFGQRPTRAASRLRMEPAHVGAPLGVRPARALEAAGAAPAGENRGILGF